MKKSILTIFENDIKLLQEAVGGQD